MGFEICQAQTVLQHRDANSLKGFGAEVPEVVSSHDGDTFRAVCTVRFETVIHVLHAFQKKAKRGIATPQKELGPVWHRLGFAERHYADAQSRRAQTSHPGRGYAPNIPVVPS